MPKTSFTDTLESVAASLLKDATVEVKSAVEAENRLEALFSNLLQHKVLPEEGWSDGLITSFLHRISQLDSNNFLGNVGAGEREGRVYSNLVRERHFQLAHGIGRSGDVAAVQPKAIGSSVLNKLTTNFVLHLLKKSLNMNEINAVLLLPMATGMAMSLVLLALRYESRGT